MITRVHLPSREQLHYPSTSHALAPRPLHTRSNNTTDRRHTTLYTKLLHTRVKRATTRRLLHTTPPQLRPCELYLAHTAASNALSLHRSSRTLLCAGNTQTAHNQNTQSSEHASYEIVPFSPHHSLPATTDHTFHAQSRPLQAHRGNRGRLDIDYAL